jgi:hypothetical protein
VKTNTIYRNLILTGSVIVLLFSACRKTEDLGEARLFRPVMKALESEGNWVRATWQPIKNAKSYSVQISKDTFKTYVQDVVVDSNSVLFSNLLWNQLYQVQVKAIANDTAFNSKVSFLGAIKTPKFPSILLSPTISDVTDEAIKVSWVPSGAAVTSIKLLKLSDSSLVRDVTLTPADLTNQYKIISGLASATTYIVYLYSGTTVRGWENFTTKAPLSGTIIDLRGITGRPSVITDTLPIIASGSTIILKRGESYTIGSTTNLSKSVKFISGSDLSVPTQATINMPSNFNIVAGSAIDYIDFEDVYLRGTDYTAKYVFNISNACTLGRISFEGCRMEIFRGVCRLQTAVINLSNFSVNNSIIDSISNYGVINVDNVNCKAENISITNSTIYKAEKVIVSKSNSTSVVIDNCTFNETPFGLTGTTYTYIVDYNTLNIANGLSIKNSIFGVGKPNAGNTIIRDVRVGATTIIDASNNYFTNDRIVSAPTYAIPNIIAYPGPATQLFMSPFTGDFKIRDATFVGKNSSGDPRWRP